MHSKKVRSRSNQLCSRKFRQGRPFWIEQFEDRTVPASIFWDGGGDGVNWASANNWSTNVLPTSADDVTISGTGTITISTGLANAHNLVSARAVNMTGGTLTAATIQVNNTLTVNSGATIANARLLAGTGSAAVYVYGTLQSAQIETVVSGAGFTVKNGLALYNRLNVASSATFVGTQSITGAGGQIWTNSSYATIYAAGTGTAAGAATLTIGSGITIFTAATNNTFQTAYGAYDRIINQGTIQSNAQTTVLKDVSNQGTINVYYGTLTAQATSSWSNTGIINLTGGGTLTLGSAASTWSSSGTINVSLGTGTLITNSNSSGWSAAAGAFNISGGTVQLGGYYTQAGLGTFTRSGGNVSITGVLSGDLTLNSTTGSFGLNSGTVKNGVVTLLNGATLLASGSNIGGSRFDNVTLGSDYESNRLSILNGLNLGGHTWSVGSLGLGFGNIETISGPGTILLNSTYGLAASGNGGASAPAIVTIGPSVVIKTNQASCAINVGFVYDKWINQGTVIAGSSERTLTLNNFENQGTVDASYGDIALGTNYLQSAGQTIVRAGRNFGSAGYTSTFNGGSLTGVGTVQGTVINSAVVAPGINAIGQLTITGSYTQAATGLLALEIASASSFDKLLVNGAATLNGALTIDTPGSPSLPRSGSLGVLSGASVTGSFASVTDLDTTHLHGFNLSYSPNLVSINYTTPPIVNIQTPSDTIRNEYAI